MDYYKILNLDEDASLAQIEQAYLDLSAFYNPKNNVSKLAYKKYREIEQAYKVLKENKQREIYNLSKKEVAIKDDLNNDQGSVLTFNDYNKNKFKDDILDISRYQDTIVSDVYSDYKHLHITLPYLYYLVNSEYRLSFYKEIIVSSKDVCPRCLGIGKVKEDNKIVYCKECKKTGKKIEIKQELVEREVKVEDKVILDDDKVIVEFEFNDRDNYLVNGNEIELTYYVSKDEFYHGVKFHLKNESELVIEKNNFDSLKESYVFSDKVIKINYVLGRYKGENIKGYLVTDKDVIYLNPKDYCYSFTPSDVCTYKVELDSDYVVVPYLGKKGYQDKNGDLLLEVIKLKNESDLKIFFNRKVKRVSAKLFSLKGYYHHHYFNGKKRFDYDDNYLYIPSLAHTLKLKHYLLFKLIFSSLYLLVPLILFLIFKISYAFFISSIIFIIVYLIIVNLVMEVKM